VNQIYQAQIIYTQATRVRILFLIILSLNFSQSHTQQELNHTSAINSPNSLSSSNAIAEVFRNLKIPQVPAFDLTDPTVNLSVIPNDQTPALMIQKPEFAHLETPNLVPNEANTRVTDLIDTKFYDGYIKPGDLSSKVASNGAMYTLASPGRYYISNDITVAPNNNTVTAIRISANNVLLDLNRATISQSSSSSKTGLIGLELASGVTNVIIQNGRIDSFSGTGININTNCANIIIRDVIVSRSTKYGININTSNTIYLQNVKAVSGSNASGSCWGLNLTTCHNVLVQNSNFDNNNGISNSSFGIDIASASYQCVFENCTANNNGSTTCATSYGILVYNSTSNCWFKNCESSYNQGTSWGYGFIVLTSCSNIRLSNCSAFGQIGGTGATNFAAGFYFDDTTKYSIIEDSYSYGNGAGTTYAGYGIYFGNGTSAGPLNCIVRNCQIYDNIGTTKSYGFYDWASAAVGSTTVLAHNVASGNGKINPSAGNFTPSNSNSANYYIQYGQTPANNSNSLFFEGNFTAIGAINGTGILGEFQNLSIIS
jgi:hypothetical protein